MARLLVVALLLLPHAAAAAEKIDVAVRGKTLTLTVYRPGPPAAPPRGTILMGSGDVGWVGLAVTMAEELSAQGYVVAGINVRQYLSSFTSGKSHLQPADVPGDYRVFRDTLQQKGALVRPVVLSGVSEGAALAVLAASDGQNHDWIDGVITMGIPPTAELAWRWTDVGAWITKHDADEPSFAPSEVIAKVAPLPLYMIQSSKDEYVPKAEYERLEAAARDPKKLVLIDASNHRFTDRRPELRSAYMAGLAWISQRAPSRSTRQ
jgi:alpha-beta hydrolase superfamily lysophospholipase